MNMQTLFAVAVFAVTCVACSNSDSGAGDDPCSRASKCANDPKPTAEQITACQKGQGSGAKCSTESNAMSACVAAKQRCTSDGKSDPTVLTSDCKTEYNAYLSCITGGLIDGGTGDTAHD